VGIIADLKTFVGRFLIDSNVLKSVLLVIKPENVSS
jgi:hypothetical protein